MSVDFTKYKRILVYRLGSLGDSIIVLPCFHKVKETFPHAKITLLTNRPVHAKAPPVISVIGQNFFDNVIEYPIGTRNPLILFKILWQIRKSGIDLVVNLTAMRSMKASIRDKRFFRFAGVRHFFGFPDGPEDFNKKRNLLTGEIEWEATRLARTIHQLGKIDLQDDRYWNLLLSQSEISRAKEILGIHIKKEIIAISPGTKMQSKDWEEKNWLNLLNKMKEVLNEYFLLVVGSPEEKAIGEKSCTVWGENSVNLCGAVTLRESAAMLKYAKLFIGHDSGPMHLSAAMGVPCLAIFSARNIPREWFPRGNKNKIIYHKTNCAGCNLEICIIEKKKCILSITVEEVYEKVVNMLKSHEIA
jgi:ADP-heptose:LPS heptosyltransferase